MAYYGDKPPAVEDLILGAQAILLEALPGRFHPYDLRQVHATLISLEGFRTEQGLLNLNYFNFRGERRVMHLDGALSLLKVHDLLPIRIRIGGFDAHARYPFSSRGLHPYQRSFCVNGDIAVAMGWPVDDTGYPTTLDELRRRFNSANILHKYHRKPQDQDNDFYFVLGNLNTDGAEPASIEAARSRLLEHLSHRAPLTVELSPDILRVIVYTNPRVPPETTLSLSLEDAERHLQELIGYYRDRPPDTSPSI